MQQNTNNLESLYVKENRCCSCSSNCKIVRLVILFILMVAIWAVIVIIIVTQKYIYFIIVFSIYIFYIFIEFCFSYKVVFSKQKTPLEMKTLIGNLFTQSPSIEFICDIYDHQKKTDSEGNEVNESIYIDSDYLNLDILSSRDVSGVLNFNYEGYSYVYLDLEVEIHFGDTISYD